MPGLLSASELSRDRIERLLDSARVYHTGAGRSHPHSVVGLFFFEDSLRTRVGFDVAAARLQARTTMICGPKHSDGMWSPETVIDTLRSVGAWFDVLCLRHPDENAPTAVAEALPVPVINCGNGTDEHPTQALVDLWAITELVGGVDGLAIALVGDLHGMRTAHSLALALSRFNDVRVRCIAPEGLGLPDQFARPLREAASEFQTTTAMQVHDVDVVYVAGLPAETRVGVLSATEQARYHVTPETVSGMPPTSRVLCPLPRVDEIASRVDSTVHAGYFEQSRLSIAMRQAILDEVLYGSR